MHPHSHHPIVGVIVLLMFVAGFFSAFLATADFSALNRQIAEALLAALNDAKLTQKQVYIPMRYSKGNWSKVLSGEKTLSLVRLHLAPYDYYVAVWTRLIAIKARDFASELREDAARVRNVLERTHAA